MARSVRHKRLAAHSVCSPPPCGEGLGVGVVVILLGVFVRDTADLRERHAVASRLRVALTCHLRTYQRVLTATPTPNPSPQGGGEQTEFAARLNPSQQDGR